MAEPGLTPRLPLLMIRPVLVTDEPINSAKSAAAPKESRIEWKSSKPRMSRIARMGFLSFERRA